MRYFKKDSGYPTVGRTEPPNTGHKQAGMTKLRHIIAGIIFLICLQPSSAHADDFTAGAAIVMQGDSNEILYAKNPHLKMLPASTTKLLTAIVVLENIDPDTVITVSKKAAGTPSVSPFLEAGEKFTVRDLLHLALMRSVNGAAVALAEGVANSEAAFVGLMNKRLPGMGIRTARFINATGLPGDGQFITALDLAILMREAIRVPLINKILNEKVKEIASLDGRSLFIKNTNQLLWAGQEILGGKTGYTRAAKHCFVCAAHKGGTTMIAVVLGVPVRQNLWKETAYLMSLEPAMASRETKSSLKIARVK